VQKRKNIGKKAAATGGKLLRSRGSQGSRSNRGSGGSGSGSGSGGSDQESDIDSTPAGGSWVGSQGAPESIAEEEQEQDTDIPGSLVGKLSGKLSSAAKAVKDTLAMAPFSPALKVHPLPISGTGSKREREDKPRAEEDNEVRSTYFPVSDLFGGNDEGQSDAKGVQRTSDAPQVGTKEDELRP
jgi:hypothetical protein